MEIIIIQILFIIISAIILKIRLDQTDNIRLNHKTLSELNSLHIRIEELERQQSARLDNPTPGPNWPTADQDWKQKELERRDRIKEILEQRDQQDWSREREDI